MIVLGAVAVAGVWVIRISESGVDRFEGKTAHEWVGLYLDHEIDGGSDRAFARLGDSAIDCLVDSLEDDGGVRTSSGYRAFYTFLYRRWKPPPRLLEDLRQPTRSRHYVARFWRPMPSKHGFMQYVQLAKWARLLAPLFQ